MFKFYSEERQIDCTAFIRGTHLVFILVLELSLFMIMQISVENLIKQSRMAINIAVVNSLPFHLILENPTAPTRDRFL